MSVVTPHLELIVEDLRAAAERSIERARRRRRRQVAALAAGASLAVAAGVAGAVAGTDYVDLIRNAYPGAQVSDLGQRQQLVLAHLGDGIDGGVVVTDLGVTDGAAPAPPGTSSCDWVASAKLFECTSPSDVETIPAATRVYRVQPASTPMPGGEARVMYVPALQLELLVDPAPRRS